MVLKSVHDLVAKGLIGDGADELFDELLNLVWAVDCIDELAEWSEIGLILVLNEVVDSRFHVECAERLGELIVGSFGGV